MPEYRDVLCMGCMSALPETGKCRCGFDETIPVAEDALPLRTLIDGRYVVGKELFRNGEEITYIGFDISEEDRVYLTEFFPFGVAKRNGTSNSLVPVSGKETDYKVMMSDFEDLFRGLSRFAKTEYIVPVLSVVSDNGTVYAVSKYVRTISYIDYLQHNGGEFTWSQVKKLFMPLFTQLSNLHAEGFVHRGISPESIRVNAKGKLLLSRFGTSDLYFNGSDITPKLNEGYSAPEEYSGSSKQGAFTDVYSVAAVLYRTLTGTLPVSADDRMRGEELVAPEDLEPGVPSNVSDAIMNAMTMNPDYRLQTIDEFTAELLEETGSNTVMFSPREMEEIEKTSIPESPAEKKDDGEKKERKKARRKFDDAASEDGVQLRVPWGVVSGVIFFVILLVTVIIILNSGILGLGGGGSHSGMNASDGQMYESGEENGGYLLTVPNFVGRMRADVEGNSQYGMFDIEFTEEENSSYTEGMIFDQSVKYRTQVENGQKIVLKVSTGAEKVEMPEVTGHTLQEAQNMLNEAGIVFQAIPNYDSEHAYNIVYEQSVEAGSKVVAGNTLTKVYIYYGAEDASSSSSSSSKKDKDKDKDRGDDRVIHIGSN